jgi:hypothetical protein
MDGRSKDHTAGLGAVAQLLIMRNIHILSKCLKPPVATIMSEKSRKL